LTLDIRGGRSSATPVKPGWIVVSQELDPPKRRYAWRAELCDAGQTMLDCGLAGARPVKKRKVD
jgi:hypothetical protein